MIGRNSMLQMVQTFRCTPLTFQQSEFEYDILRNMSSVWSVIRTPTRNLWKPVMASFQIYYMLLTKKLKKPYDQKKWFLKGFHRIHHWQTIPPVDLYLISEKSIWKNQVWRTRFLICITLNFYCLCSLQKSILKLIFAG